MSTDEVAPDLAQRPHEVGERARRRRKENTKRCTRDAKLLAGIPQRTRSSRTDMCSRTETKLPMDRRYVSRSIPAQTIVRITAYNSSTPKGKSDEHSREEKTLIPSLPTLVFNEGTKPQLQPDRHIRVQVESSLRHDKTKGYFHVDST